MSSAALGRRKMPCAPWQRSQPLAAAQLRPKLARGDTGVRSSVGPKRIGNGDYRNVPSETCV